MPTTQIVIVPHLFSHHYSDPFEGTFDISGLFCHFNYIQHNYSQFKKYDFYLVGLHRKNQIKKFQVKHLKFWQVYYHSRYFTQNVPTSMVKGDQKLTNEMSIH